MRPTLQITHTLLASLIVAAGARADQWPQFRGPGGDGIIAGQSAPVSFGESKGVVWKTELEGRGWSSPLFADDVIWVSTAVERTPTEQERLAMLRDNGIEEKKFKQLAIARSIELKLIAVDFQTGSILRTIDLATIDDPDPIHTVNSYASPTPVIDGSHLYCHFGTYGTFCVDRTSGQILWQRTFPLAHSVGPGSSPFVYKNLLILIQDGMQRQYVVALDKASGQTVWEKDRPPMDAVDGDHKKAFCTPIAVTDKLGREQLICLSSQFMVAHDPSDGSEIWRLYHGKGFSVVPRPVHADGVVYFSTGFTKPQLWAVRIDGEGDVTDTHVVWTVGSGIPSKPSPVVHDGLVYVVSDNGVASCFDAADGGQVWKQRLGGDYSSSPFLVGGHLYFASHDGKVTVMKPGKDGQVVEENQIAGKIMATPAVVNNAIILRTAEALYRIE